MEEIKRLNYFTSQFLVEEDFKDEQLYHRDMRYRHNRSLHTWGVVDGLLVIGAVGQKQVAISAGMAIDKNGMEIIVPSDPPPDPLLLIGSNTKVFITISYNDGPTISDTTSGVDNQFRRIAERAKIESILTQPPEDGKVILLASVDVDADGKIKDSIDNKVRTLATAKVAPNSITTSQLADRSVVADKLASDSVKSWNIVDGSVTTAELANRSVITEKLADSSVNSDKILDGSVGTDELANGSVTSEKLAANSVNSAKIIDGSVGTTELANGSVNADKLDSQVSRGMLRAFVSFKGSGVIENSFNVESVTRLEVGGYQIKWSVQTNAYGPFFCWAWSGNIVAGGGSGPTSLSVNVKNQAGVRVDDDVNILVAM